MKHLKSTIAVVYDGSKPTETKEVIFKFFKEEKSVEEEMSVFSFTSYAIIPGTPDEHVFINVHSKTLTKPEMNAMWAIVEPQITSTEYADIEEEKILRGAMEIIETDGFFGLTKADLVIL